MIIGEVIQRIQSLYSKGVETDDSRLSSRHIYNKLLTVRARVIVQELRKNRSLSEWDMQPLDCIEMIEQQPIPCGGIYKCPFMKSKYTLPAAITPDDTENVSIRSYDSQTIYSRTTFESYKYLKGNKYTSREPYYYIDDDYLYLINSKMKIAHMHAIFRDPIEAWRIHLSYQNKDTCFNNKTVSFFTPPELTEAIIEVSSKELIEGFVLMKEDITNNSRDSSLEETK